MKIKILYIGLSIFLLSWIIPSLVQLTMDSSPRYPFTYYSSVINQFCYLDQDNDNVRGKDMSGKVYSDAEFDRVLPMFYYRQLAMENAIPDSIQGVPVDRQTIARNNFFFWYKPKDKNTPVIELYPMFESCSGKVDLENPSDMFRLKENIEFIDMATNRVDEQKSARFQQAMEKAGFTFPALWVTGIPTSQKSYDEGYFALDNKGHLFHIKMTNGKPFVNVPMLTPEEYTALDRIRIEHIQTMADMFEPWLREIFPKLKIRIPKHLEGRIAEFRKYSCYAIPMAFIKKAIQSGDFNNENATPPMVFVVDDMNRSIR